ncbi:MAG: cation transporting ATPase C-terminal domain-containing protein [Candidatus Xenobiia bacterium LiM19]
MILLKGCRAGYQTATLQYRSGLFPELRWFFSSSVDGTFLRAHFTAACLINKDQQEARNLLFTLLVLMQFFHVLNCRSESISAFLVPIRNNRVLITGMIIAFIVHLAAVYLPFTQPLLQIAPLTLERWLLLGALASLVIIVMEIFKWLRRAGR